MKMKFLICIVVFSLTLWLISSNMSFLKSGFNLQNHLSMMMKFKSKTQSMLQNLYLSANHVEMERRVRTNSRSKTQNSSHMSSLSKLKNKYKRSGQKYIQYRYKNYQEIVDQLMELANQYPDYLKVSTAQELYGLPNPGGYCNAKTKEYLLIYLGSVFITSLFFLIIK
jgi:hypothetical protein